MRLLLLALVPLLTACHGKRDLAPDDMDGLVRYLFQHFEDPEALALGMDNLGVWLDDEGRTETATEGYLLTNLDADDVWDVNHPGRDLDDLIGVAVGGVSRHVIEAHAALLPLEDQMWADPSGYERYDRWVVDGSPQHFPDGKLEDAFVLRTENAIEKKGAFNVRIPYTLWKDYQWVHLDGDRRAVVGRSWITEVSCADGGSNCLEQSFSIDLFYARDHDDTVRLTATWNELKTTVDVPENMQVGMMVKGLNDVYANTDDHLDELGY